MREERNILLETLKVNIDTGTVSVIELEVVVGKLGEDSINLVSPARMRQRPALVFCLRVEVGVLTRLAPW